jgi:ATP synthase protein I
MKEQEQQKQENRKDPENKGLAQFGKYSGIVVQMFVVIFLTTWGGTKLDKITQLNTPVFTIVLSLFGVFAAIYLAIRDFIKK